MGNGVQKRAYYTSVSYKVWQIPKPSGIGSRELLARQPVATTRSEYFTGKRNTKKRISCLSWSWRKDLLADLLPEIPKFDNPNCPLKRIPQNRTTYKNSKCRAELGVLCNLNDQILIEPFIQPHKQICDCEQTSTEYIYTRYVWRDTSV